MKNLSVLLTMIISFLFISACSDSNANKKKDDSELRDQTVLYYFHTDRRCKTCVTIEKTAKETCEKYFAEYMKNGKLTFKTVNIDKKENLDLAIKFEAAGSKLCTVKYDSDGNLEIDDITDFAFTNAFSGDELELMIKKLLEKDLAE